MQTIQNMGAQGDVLFRRVAAIPGNAKAVPQKGRIVVSHSDAGHHHAIEPGRSEVNKFEVGDPLLSFLSVGDEGAEVVHLRPHDTHESVFLPAGFWAVHRQREYTPEGWRRVED